VQDLRCAREYRHLLTAKAPQVWPGWKRLPPLLQLAGGCEFLVGHPAPPKKFRQTNMVVGGWKIYAAPAGTATPGPVASTWKVGSVWVAMVPTRDEFQRAVDRQLGRGVVRLTDTAYMRSLVHEAFHAHQMTITRGKLPSFGNTLQQDDAAALLAPLGDADQQLAREGQALAAGVNAHSLAAARTYAVEFATRRATRRNSTSDPQGARGVRTTGRVGGGHGALRRSPPCVARRRPRMYADERNPLHSPRCIQAGVPRQPR
jgi:hypothetical protein